MIKKQQNRNERHAALDPGYLMLAVYVLGVSFLVMFAWLGGNNTALESGQQGKDKIVAHELTEQSVLAHHFTADKG